MVGSNPLKKPSSLLCVVSLKEPSMKTFLTFLYSIIAISTIAQKQPYQFTENKHQWNDRVHYKAAVPSGNLYLEKDRLTYDLFQYSGLHHNTNESDVPELKGHAFSMVFLAANEHVQLKGQHPQPYREHYFVGPKRNWSKHVNTYQEVVYNNLYSNIDLQLYTHHGQLKYDLIVRPGGHPEAIEIAYEGVQNIALTEEGLILYTAVGKVIEQTPYVYQMIHGKEVPVLCETLWDAGSHQISFQFPQGYDASLPLVIDPVLEFSTYSGSLADNFAYSATYDDDGHLYTGGIAFDNGYPVTLGAYDTTFSGIPAYGNNDIVISKYTADGDSMLYATYLGGVGTENVSSMMVGQQGTLYFFGATSSADFPTTANAYDTSFNGGTLVQFTFHGAHYDAGSDLYVAQLSGDGSSLLQSTYVGGTGNDGLNYNSATLQDTLIFNFDDQFRGELMLDSNDNCYIATTTRSADFPMVNGFDNTLGGIQDGVVFKLDNSLSNIVWSSYVGGSDFDALYGLVLDSLHGVYVTGGTISSDYPTTGGALHPTFQGGVADGVITRISNDGSSITASTFLGTNQFDQSYKLSLSQGNVGFVGQTIGNFPITPGVYFNDTIGQCIGMLGPQLDTLLYATIIGSNNGTANLSPTAFMVDGCGNIFLAGWGKNLAIQGNGIQLPTTPTAYQISPANTTDAYVMVMGPGASQLIYGSYLGGPASMEHLHGGTNRFDEHGTLYHTICAGCGGSSDFPTTPGAFAYTNGSSNCNQAAFKWKMGNGSIWSSFIWVETGLTVAFTNQSFQGTSYFWDFGDGNTSTLEHPTHTYAPGVYNACLTVSDGCFSDVSCQTITVIGTGIAQNNQREGISIFPNPFSNATTFNIPFIDQYDGLQLNLYDALGKLVRHEVVTTASFQLYRNDLAQGLYTYQLKTNTQLLATGKLIIESP